MGGVCILDPERSVGLTNKEIRLSLKPLSHHQTGVEEARPEKQRYSFFYSNYRLLLQNEKKESVGDLLV